METNLAPAASFEEERMDEEENLDLYQSGVDTTLRSIDVAESAFSPSVSSSRAQQSVSETSVSSILACLQAQLHWQTFGGHRRSHRTSPKLHA